jgi:hypothetical protein
MEDIDIQVAFSPEKIKAGSKNETVMTLKLSTSGESVLWCECIFLVKYPLSLAYDKELGGARSKLGLLRPGKALEKRIRLYTMPNNRPGPYQIGVVAQMYGEDGVIEDRQERKFEIECV